MSILDMDDAVIAESPLLQQIKQYAKFQENTTDAFLNHVVRPQLELLWQKIKARKWKNGIRYVQGMGTSFFAENVQQSVGVDRIYQCYWSDHNWSKLCERIPELEEFELLADTVAETFNMEIGDFS